LKSGESFDALIEEFLRRQRRVNYVSKIYSFFRKNLKTLPMSIETRGQFPNRSRQRMGILFYVGIATLEAADPWAFEDVRADLESLLSENSIATELLPIRKMQWLKEANIRKSLKNGG
jgi:hypothetical protein